MSKFRERAAEVKAAGEEARGDFTPNGVPKRMYQWWLENSPSDKAADIASGQRRENFCHFWRVVVIWTPLLWLAMKILDPVLEGAERVSPKAALVAVGILFLGITALIATTTGTWMEVLIACAWLLVAAAVVLAIGGLLYWLHENTENGIEWFLGTIVGLVIIGALIAAFVDFGWIIFVWISVFAIGVVALIAGAIFIGTVIENLRADSRKRANEAEEAAWDAYENDEGPHPYERAPREPSRFKKFFTGIGDFLTLIAQVVRVNKWKICPLVDVDVPAKPVRAMPGAPLWD